MVDTPTTIEPGSRIVDAQGAGAAIPAAHTAADRVPTAIKTVAVVGLGYVGLPTSIALAAAGLDVVGIDVSERRLADVREGSADLLEDDQERLEEVLAAEQLMLSCAPDVLADADAVLVCVPLAKRGLEPGIDVHVAFSPERIDPGNTSWRQEAVPRVVGGVTPDCTHAAGGLIEKIAACVHPVSSAEAAELTKLYENSFRAVNIAFANEMAGIGRRFGLEPLEVIEAAGTKPYGFMKFYPGPGVGGHCIPCDPYYRSEEHTSELQSRRD